MKKSKKSSFYYCEMWNLAWRETNDLFGLKGQFIQNAFILVVLSISLWQWFGLKFAMDNIWQGYWPNIIGLFILIVVAPLVTFYKMFWVIPREYRKKQKEIKSLENKLTSEVVNADVDLIPFSLDDDKVYALLRVENKERSRDITNCRAKLTNFFTTWKEQGTLMDFTDSITAREYPFFYWRDNNDKYMDIEHSGEKILCIAVAKEHKSLSLSILKDGYDFPVVISQNGKGFYEIRFRIEMTGTVGNKHQVFYKNFFGKVIYRVIPSKDDGKLTMVDVIEFNKVEETELVESLHP